MKNSVKFIATIIQNGTMDAGFVEIPFDVKAVFGKLKVKIKAIFDGRAEYRGSLHKMGGSCHILGITKEIRAEIGKSFGDEVSVELWEDTDERTVEISEDIQEILTENPEAKNLFDKMSYTHRKEYIRWIEEAKKTETRDRRKSKMIEMILAGKKGI